MKLPGTAQAISATVVILASLLSPTKTSTVAAPILRSASIGAPTVPALPTGPIGLDHSGKTISSTNFPVPSGAIFMSPAGNDRNAGTLTRPVKTLNRAVGLVPTNGTIVMRGGVYRDALSGPNGTLGGTSKSMTIQAYPGEKPWLDGSEVVPASNWKRVAATQWSMSWSTPSFCDGGYYKFNPLHQSSDNRGPCTHVDVTAGTGPASIPSDPQQIWVDGTPQTQVATRAALRANTFYYDWVNRRMYISADPSRHTLEVSRRPNALILAAGKFLVRGIGVRRYATNEYPNRTSAAIYLGDAVAIFDHDTFTENSAAAVGYSSPKPGSVVKYSVFAHNGHTPLLANGQSGTGIVSNLVVSDNVFNYNDDALMGQKCTISCANEIGPKFAHIIGLTFTRNLIENARGIADGISCDLNCSRVIYSYNVIRNLPLGSGIAHEVSGAAVIGGNVVVNTKYGINVASANTQIYNNTVINASKEGLRLYDDSRSVGYGGWSNIGPNTTSVEISNNIVVQTSSSAVGFATFPGSPFNSYPHTLPGQYFRRVDNNLLLSTGSKIASWQATKGSSAVIFAPSMRQTFAQQHKAFASASIWRTAAPTVLMSGFQSGDYHVTAPTMLPKAATLPTNVATALGVAPRLGVVGAFSK